MPALLKLLRLSLQSYYLNFQKLGSSDKGALLSRKGFCRTHDRSLVYLQKCCWCLGWSCFLNWTNSRSQLLPGLHVGVHNKLFTTWEKWWTFTCLAARHPLVEPIIIISKRLQIKNALLLFVSLSARSHGNVRTLKFKLGTRPSCYGNLSGIKWKTRGGNTVEC